MEKKKLGGHCAQPIPGNQERSSSGVPMVPVAEKKLVGMGMVITGVQRERCTEVRRQPEGC